MKLYKIDTENVLFTGDLHGEFQTINVTINEYNLDNCAIVICGDIGIGFESEEFYNQTFNKLTKVLKKKNIHLFMFRGNHDNKDFFDGEHFINFEYIHIIPDYSIIQTPSRNILCVGGATSIDRTWRKQNMDIAIVKYMKYHNCGWEEAENKSKKYYWENEAPIYDENELTSINELGIKIDTVCSHTAPSFCKPLTKIGIEGWLEVDPQLSEDLDNERKVFDNIFNWLKNNNHALTNWYYGHFHFNNTDFIEGVKYSLLDMSRIKLDIV